MSAVRDDRGLVRPSFMGRLEDNASIPDPKEPKVLPVWEEEEQTIGDWVETATRDVKE